MKFNVFSRSLISVFILSVFFISCKKQKDAKPPEISFKSGGIYTSLSSDATTNTDITVGIVAIKNEAELRFLEIEYSYDSGNFATKTTYNMKSNEKDRYELDYVFKTRNEIGIEIWRFTIHDLNGNTASKDLRINVK